MGHSVWPKASKIQNYRYLSIPKAIKKTCCQREGENLLEVDDEGTLSEFPPAAAALPPPPSFLSPPEVEPPCKRAEGSRYNKGQA